MHPVFQNMELGTRRKGHLNVGMVMAEDEVIYLVSGGELHGKLIQGLVFSPEHIFPVMSQAVVLRPSVSETEGDPRMEHAEKELCHTAMEHAAEETVSCRNRSQTVAVAEAECLSIYLNQMRLSQFDHSELLEIGICPDVVVAFKEKDLHSPVHKVLKGGQHPEIAFRNDITVLVPEIPDVAKQIEGLGIFRKGSQEACKATLTLFRIMNLKTEVDI
jgi:hypothetical protein